MFRSLCYVSNLQRPKDKSASTSRKCDFVRYPCGKNGWKVYDLKTGDIYVSRDVVFNKDMFPFAIKVTNKESMINFRRQDNVYLKDDFFYFGRCMMGEEAGPSHQPSGYGNTASPAARINPLPEQAGS